MPKKNTDGRGNPNPVTPPEFLAARIEPVGETFTDQPLAKKQLQVRLPQDVQTAIDSLPQAERLTWVRKVLSEAARTDLIPNQ